MVRDVKNCKWVNLYCLASWLVLLGWLFGISLRLRKIAKALYDHIIDGFICATSFRLTIMQNRQKLLCTLFKLSKWYREVRAPFCIDFLRVFWHLSVTWRGAKRWLTVLGNNRNPLITDQSPSMKHLGLD